MWSVIRRLADMLLSGPVTADAATELVKGVPAYIGAGDLSG